MHDIGKVRLRAESEQAGKALGRRVRDLQRSTRACGRDILDPIKFCIRSFPGRAPAPRKVGWARLSEIRLEGNDRAHHGAHHPVADTYDAMTSDRAYRRALPHEIATTEIDRCAGSQFDPDVAGEFNTGIETFPRRAKGPRRALRSSAERDGERGFTAPPSRRSGSRAKYEPVHAFMQTLADARHQGRISIPCCCPSTTRGSRSDARRSSPTCCSRRTTSQSAESTWWRRVAAAT